MKRLLCIIIVLFFSSTNIYAEELKIISREEWGANEAYTDVQDVYWTDILVGREAKRLERLNTEYTDEQLAKQAENSKLASKRIQYVNKNYASRYGTSGKQYYNDDIKLAWPITKSKNIDGIILHHTYSEYESSLDGVRNILKFHGINRQWGDIGYNYIIGYGGEIYEGRLGGDYAVGAHTTWNNYQTMGIALLGNYDEREMNIMQKKSLDALISHLIYKYDISMLGTIPLHKTCTDCIHGLVTDIHQPIAGHKDGGHTACPGENVYDLIPDLNYKFKSEQIKYNKIFQKLTTILSNFETEKLETLDEKLGVLATRKTSEKNKYIISRLATLVSEEIGKR